MSALAIPLSSSLPRQYGDLALDADLRTFAYNAVCILEDGRNAVSGSQSSTLFWTPP